MKFHMLAKIIHSLLFSLIIYLFTVNIFFIEIKAQSYMFFLF